MSAMLTEEYLTTEVLTASPQKLHLLLIEGALRSCVRAQSLLDERQDRAAVEAISTAQRITGKLISGLNYLQQPALAGQIAAIYAYIFKLLVMAQLRRDLAKLSDAIRLLQFERDTWRQVNEKMAGAQSATDEPLRDSGDHDYRPESAHTASDGAAPVPFSRRNRARDEGVLRGGFSCEA